MRTSGVEDAIRAAGGVGVLARSLGISQPAVSNWARVPAERVLQVEAITGVGRVRLRPDLYAEPEIGPGVERDEIDLLRSREYDLLAALVGRTPSADLIRSLTRVEGDGTPLGRAHRDLAQAARETNADTLSREYFDLFVGLGRGELLPYGSYYLTGFLNERPLARLRGDLAELGIERSEPGGDPEDHVATLLEIMAGLSSGRFEAGPSAEARFFARNLQPWVERFFTDLQGARSAVFYRSVGALGRLFMEIEAEAFSLE